MALRAAPTEETERRQTVTNIDHRIKRTITAANELLAEQGIDPISERVTPHSLRRIYASIRAALRDDPVYIAEQLGHEDPGFTFRIYQGRSSGAKGSPAPTPKPTIGRLIGQHWAAGCT